MADITIAQLAAKVLDPTVQTWWQNAAALPADTEVAEFLSKTLLAAYSAALEANASLTAGSRIDAYPSPASTTPAVNSAGVLTSLVTAAIRVRAPISLDSASAPTV
jgi:hypothetical protein